MSKVLFSTTWGPFEEQFFNTSPIDVMNQRFSRGCDIFSMGGHLHVNFAHLIAQNIPLPSVFLEYPMREDFFKELEKGYDYVALSAFHNQVDDLVEMCQAVRERSPQSKIVLGGWGAVGLESTRSKKELAKICDHLCHGEGIRFFRELLGEDPEAPMFHSHLPKWGYQLPMVTKNAPGGTPVVVGSLGCTNACDFCATTEMFDNKRVQIMTPEQVHKEFRRVWRENPDTAQATLLEEDSFNDKDYMEELGRLLREDTEFGLSYYNFYCLASIRSMSQWTFEDMMLTGASNVFVGVESKFAKENGYGKTLGLTERQMFDGLHQVGVATTGAWMVGFDFQNRSNIAEDQENFVSLRPTMQQLARVCPFPATPMWKDMKKLGRINDDVDWKSISFYGGGGMTPENFNEHEIMGIIEDGYKKLYHTHGATLARMMEVSMQGYDYCMENRKKNRYMEERAVFNKRICLTIFPLLKAMEIYAPNNIVRKRMKDLFREYIRLFGPPSSFQKAAEKALVGLSGYTKFKDLFYPQDNNIGSETFKKYTYNKPGPKWPDCPYMVDYPKRTRAFSAKRLMMNRVGSVLKDANRVSGAWDRILRGHTHDEAEKRGIFLFFF